MYRTCVLGLLFASSHYNVILRAFVYSLFKPQPQEQCLVVCNGHSVSIRRMNGMSSVLEWNGNDSVGSVSLLGCKPVLELDQQ